MNVVCVRQGDKYGPEYVRMLDRMCREHLGQPIICLGDDHPIRSYVGWWAKLELFAPWNAHLRPCLYFDLDTYILGDCRDMLAPTDDFWMVRDWFSAKRTSTSSVMILPQDTSRIWKNHLGWDRGEIDGVFLATQPHRILQDKFDGLTSFKADGRQSRIVCFHGEPKPHNVRVRWARAIWNKYSKGQE